jgi:3-oxoacyl-[acyl-carrier-protein] synthase II
MEFKRVVVTGLGALTPIGNSVSEYWEALINGVSGAAMIKSFDTSKFKTKFACEVKNFSADAFLGRKDARKLDPFVQYALYSTEEAVKDAGLDFSKLDTSRIGVIWGSGIGGLKTFLDEVSALARGDGTPHINPFFIPKMIADIAPGHISIKYGLRGPNFTTVSACASSNNSLIDAFTYIRLGKANMFVSGGSEAIINEAGIGGFNAMHALSTRNEDPATASRPFDLDRDNFRGTGTRESTRRKNLCRDDRRRNECRCLSYDRTTPGRAWCSFGYARGTARCRYRGIGDRLCKCTWHINPYRRSAGNKSYTGCFRRPCL